MRRDVDPAHAGARKPRRRSKLSQEDKSFLNIASEFLAAAELNRRKIHAAVTYGSAKSADVWAFNHATKRAVRVEVKTTALHNRKWVVGHKASVGEACDPDVFWILVHLPVPIRDGGAVEELGAHAPRFYVLSSLEIARILAAKDEQYRAQFVARNHREPPLDKGVPNVLFDDVRGFAEAWDKLASRLSLRPGAHTP